MKQSDKQKKTCTVCKKSKVVDRNYYESKSPMFNGTINICTSCIRKQIDYNNREDIYALLRQIDVVFDYEVWESATKSSKDTFGRYMSMIHTLPQLKGKTYKDSRFDNEKIIKSDSNHEEIRLDNISKYDFIVTDELIDKWGEGYSTEQYRLFEKKWNRLIDNYGEKTSLHTENLITYIRFRVNEEIETSKGRLKEAKEWAALATKAAQDAKINVSQLSKSDISGGVDLVSQLFEAVESEVGIIPLLPRLQEQPYDDADMVIWSIVNYTRRLEDKPPVAYRDIWNFYDEMLEEHFKQQNYDDDEILEFKKKRNNVFRDLSEVYKEPLYEGEETDG